MISQVEVSEDGSEDGSESESGIYRLDCKGEGEFILSEESEMVLSEEEWEEWFS